MLELRPDDPFVHCTDRAFRGAAKLPNCCVPVRDLEVLDVLLDLIGEDQEAEREFLDGLTGDFAVPAGELAEAMITRAGRR